MARQVVEPPVAREQRVPMNYEEYLAWFGEGHRGEWVDGEVIIFMPTKPPHQLLVIFFASLLSSYVRLLDLGVVLTEPCEMLIRRGRASRQPDVLFVAREHRARVTPDRVEGPADLVVEVISDDSVIRDRVEKFREFEAAGIPEYWLIDSRTADHRAEFHQLGSDGRYRSVLQDAAGRYASAVLPGFWLDTNWLRHDPLPEPAVLVSLIAANAFEAARRAMRVEPPTDLD